MCTQMDCIKQHGCGPKRRHGGVELGLDCGGGGHVGPLFSDGEPHCRLGVGLKAENGRKTSYQHDIGQM